MTSIPSTCLPVYTTCTTINTVATSSLSLSSTHDIRCVGETSQTQQSSLCAPVSISYFERLSGLCKPVTAAHIAEAFLTDFQDDPSYKRGRAYLDYVERLPSHSHEEKLAQYMDADRIIKRCSVIIKGESRTLDMSIVKLWFEILDRIESEVRAIPTFDQVNDLKSNVWESIYSSDALCFAFIADYGNGASELEPLLRSFVDHFPAFAYLLMKSAPQGTSFNDQIGPRLQALDRTARALSSPDIADAIAEKFNEVTKERGSLTIDRLLDDLTNPDIDDAEWQVAAVKLIRKIGTLSQEVSTRIITDLVSRLTADHPQALSTLNILIQIASIAKKADQNDLCIVALTQTESLIQKLRPLSVSIQENAQAKGLCRSLRDVLLRFFSEDPRSESVLEGLEELAALDQRPQAH